jgi:hypothetical protein
MPKYSKYGPTNCFTGYCTYYYIATYAGYLSSSQQQPPWNLAADARRRLSQNMSRANIPTEGGLSVYMLRCDHDTPLPQEPLLVFIVEPVGSCVARAIYWDFSKNSEGPE